MAKEFFMRTVSPSVDLAVSLATVKKHARIATGNVEDDLLTHYIQSATSRLEKMSPIRFRTQTVDVQFSNDFGKMGFYFLPIKPIQSITSVKIDDVENGETILSASNYAFEPISNRLRKRNSWPTISGDSITVRAIVGYATEAEIPHDLKTGLLYVVADLYKNRGDDRFNLESGDGYQTLLNGLLATYFDGQLIEST